MVTLRKRKQAAEPVAPASPAPAMSAMSAFALRRKLMQDKEAALTQFDSTTDNGAAKVVEPSNAEALPEEPAANTAAKGRKRRHVDVSEKSDKAVEAETAKGLSFKNQQSPRERSEQNPDAVEQATTRAAATSRPQREAPAIQRTTFRPSKENLHETADGRMRLKLSEGERVVILGSYGVTVRKGEITLAGATLRESPKTHWAHAPQCHALPVIRCTNDEATVVLQPHPSAASLRQLARLSPMFGRLWNEGGSSLDRTFQILYSADDGAARSQDLVAPPEWNKLISELVSGQKAGGNGASSSKAGQGGVYFVCGPKSSGKSTFSRLLTNRLLTQHDGSDRQKRRSAASVAVLDIDPGQPEFATPGTVSLVQLEEPNLAPPFCHPSTCSSNSASTIRQLRAHDLATVSPAMDPEHYIACVLDLFAVYLRDLRGRCPLVVNTPGWVQGTGLDILCELAARMRPTQLVYMSHDGPDETIQGLRTAYHAVPLVELPSQPGEHAGRTAAHLRAMQTMSYFHLDASLLPSPPPLPAPKMALPTPSWDATPVTAMRPWMVPYTGPDSGILGVLCYESRPPLDLFADAINGTVVSIVAVDNAAAFWLGSTDEEEAFTRRQQSQQRQQQKDQHRILPTVLRSPEGIPCIVSPVAGMTRLDPRHSHALGLALIRGIDTENKLLQLLTPLPAAQAIADVMEHDGLGVVLVAGKLDSPTWAYTEELYMHRAEGSQGQGAIEEGSSSEEESDDDGDGSDGGDGKNGVLDTAEDLVDAETEADSGASQVVPWVEVLCGNQKRAAGSRVWRVRRDLGRNSSH